MFSRKLLFLGFWGSVFITDGFASSLSDDFKEYLERESSRIPLEIEQLMGHGSPAHTAPHTCSVTLQWPSQEGKTRTEMQVFLDSINQEKLRKITSLEQIRVCFEEAIRDLSVNAFLEILNYPPFQRYIYEHLDWFIGLWHSYIWRDMDLGSINIESEAIQNSIYRLIELEYAKFNLEHLANFTKGSEGPLDEFLLKLIEAYLLIDPYDVIITDPQEIAKTRDDIIQLKRAIDTNDLEEVENFLQILNLKLNHDSMLCITNYFANKIKGKLGYLNDVQAEPFKLWSCEERIKAQRILIPILTANWKCHLRGKDLIQQTMSSTDAPYSAFLATSSEGSGEPTEPCKSLTCDPQEILSNMHRGIR